MFLQMYTFKNRQIICYYRFLLQRIKSQLHSDGMTAYKSRMYASCIGCIYTKPQPCTCLPWTRSTKKGVEKKTRPLEAFCKSSGLSFFYLAGKLRALAGCSPRGDVWFQTLDALRNTHHSELCNTKTLSTNTHLRFCCGLLGKNVRFL